MSDNLLSGLGQRERQIVETVYRWARQGWPRSDPNSQIRPAIPRCVPCSNLLEGKGYLKHERDGVRYVYAPAIAPKKARQSALGHLVTTFFQGSPVAAATALLELPGATISPENLARLNELIARGRKGGQMTADSILVALAWKPAVRL